MRSKELNPQDLSGVQQMDEQLVLISFAQSFFQFLKHTEAYDRENEIFEKSFDEIERTLSNVYKYYQTTSAEISFMGEQVYVNQKRARPRPRQFYIFRYLLRFMKTHNVGTIVIHEQASRRDISIALRAISQIDPTDINGVQILKEILQSENVGFVEVKPSFRFKDNQEDFGELEDAEKIIIALYEKIRNFVEISFDNFEHATKFNLGNIKSFIEDLVQLDYEDIIHVLRLLGLKRYDKPLPYLSVNTAYIVMSWAQWLRLPLGVVAELTEAALLHPLVYLAQKKDQPMQISYTQEELNLAWDLHQRLEGVWPMTDLQRLTGVEWGVPFGEAGVYEVEGEKTYAHVFSRMIRIVALFEQLTTFYPGKKTFLPDEAMRELLRLKNEVDPTLLKLFINWMGIYPVGSFVQLQSGEIAQIYAGSSDPLRFQRPVVCVLKDGDGNLLKRPYLLDLTDMNERIGVYRRSIKRSLSSEEINLPRELLGITPLGIQS